MASWQDVYDDGVLRITRTGSPPALAIAGEIDESTYPGLVSTLERVVDGQGEIHANLVGVTYCDLAGLRTIVGLAGANGGDHEHNGRRLVLHEVPRRLKTVLQIMGWDATPGLAIHEPGHYSHEPGRYAYEPGHYPQRARVDQALQAAAWTGHLVAARPLLVAADAFKVSPGCPPHRPGGHHTGEGRRHFG